MKKAIVVFVVILLASIMAIMRMSSGDPCEDDILRECGLDFDMAECIRQNKVNFSVDCQKQLESKK